MRRTELNETLSLCTSQRCACAVSARVPVHSWTNARNGAQDGGPEVVFMSRCDVRVK